MDKRIALFLLLGPLLPLPAAAFTAVGTTTPNAYMVENTSGTNNCYYFQTKPTCAASISNLTVAISSSAIPPGSTNYIQNTANPTIATQVFNVSSGTVSTLNYSTASIAGNQVYGIFYSSMVCVTASSSTTSSAYVPTNSTITITPKRTTSRIEIDATGVVSTTSGLTDGVNLSLFRGATNLAAASSTPIMAIYDPDVGGLSVGSLSMHFIDLPNSTSALVYTVQIHGDGGGGTVTWNRSNVLSCISVKEWGY